MVPFLVSPQPAQRPGHHFWHDPTSYPSLDLYGHQKTPPRVSSQAKHHHMYQHIRLVMSVLRFALGYNDVEQNELLSEQRAIDLCVWMQEAHHHHPRTNLSMLSDLLVRSRKGSKGAYEAES